MIKNRKLLIISLLAVMVMFFVPNKTKAGFQANKGGTSFTNVTADVYFIGARNMEISYGTLGKSAVLDDKKLDTTKNGIDSHMVLNTEWGAAALLADSAFGVGKEGTDSKKTSTGNDSGICNLANGHYEYTATIFDGKTNDFNKLIGSSDARYFNNYSANVAKNGDALECKRWLNAGSAFWINETTPIFTRGYGGYLFSYTSYNGNTSMFTSRAVAVCGEGL